MPSFLSRFSKDRATRRLLERIDWGEPVSLKKEDFEDIKSTVWAADYVSVTLQVWLKKKELSGHPICIQQCPNVKQNSRR